MCIRLLRLYVQTACSVVFGRIVFVLIRRFIYSSDESVFAYMSNTLATLCVSGGSAARTDEKIRFACLLAVVRR